MAYIFLLIISLIMYYNTNYGVDYTQILTSFAIFLCGSIGVCRKALRTRDYISFNVIFLFSFFFVTYCAPMFVLGTDNEISMIASRFINFDYSTKATSLCTIAICAYFCGFNTFHNNKKQIIPKPFYKIKISSYLSKLFIISTIALFLNVVWIIMREGVDIIALTDNPFIFELFKVFLIIIIVQQSCINRNKIRNVYDMIRDNKLSISLAFPVLLFFLYLGDRGLSLVIVFSFLGLYTLFYKKIKLSILLLVGFIGVMSMFVIRETRTSDSALKNSDVGSFVETSQDVVSDKSILYMFSDLYGACQELYLGYEYKEKHGLYYPEQALIIPFTPFPFVPTILSKFMFGKTPYEMSPGMVLNDYVSTNKYEAHFGDHIVSNIYMRWGVLGIIICFFFLGKVIFYFERNKLVSIQCAACYIYLLSHALYLPRSSMFDIFRPIAFIYLFIYLGYKISNKKNEKNI